MKPPLASILLLSAGLFLFAALPPLDLARADDKPAPTLKSVLLAQFKATHNVQEWFVPAMQAVDGLTAEQAMWKEGNADHSIAQLVTHITFWDQQQLAKFKGEKPAAYDGNNVETFAPVDAKSWPAAVRALDDVMTGWEKAIASADEAKLQSWSAVIARINTHNAYHIGQILYVRKQQGAWDSSKGVK